ncbi:hypothetical protein B0T20DRAFT_343979 [Sordaria brevicollis]|uniref:Uncharacterized protein n=1 Tax=Sordaria brevicollis TaxID=83679 RepID=A0AAE0PMU2_SORBR|nr:hypothetical protein B0T20DRAFT_343979 [Sordaria brevicollis]
MPANFKTYEAQARLLAAVIAAHPDLRLNYKAIAQHYGKSTSTSAIEHRFRPVRKQAEFLRMAVAKGIEPETIDIQQDPGEIARMFGESTADGLQFQFRGIKNAAEAMKTAADNGDDPVQAFNNASSGSGSKTPSGRKRGRPAGTPASGRSRATPATGRSTATAKPRRSTAKKASYVEPATTTDKDESAGPVDYEALDDDSPSGHAAKKQRTTPIKTALPPRRISGAPIAQPVFKAEALDEIFEVGDRMPSPSPMPPAQSTSGNGNHNNGTTNNGFFETAANNISRNDRAESEYHTPAPEFPPTTSAPQAQSQQTHSQAYSMNAGMSFDGNVNTSFAGSTISGMPFDNHQNGYSANNGFAQPAYTSQHINNNNTQQSTPASAVGNAGANYIDIVSDDEDDNHYSQSVATSSNGHFGGGGPAATVAGNHTSHFASTNVTPSMAMNMAIMNSGGHGGEVGGFYDEDQYEI